MKFTYPAVIRKTENGTYEAFAPDLTGCEATAPDMEDIMENIYNAVYDWIYLELSENGDLPPVSEEGDLTIQEGDQIRNICVNIRLTDGWDE